MRAAATKKGTSPVDVKSLKQNPISSFLRKMTGAQQPKKTANDSRGMARSSLVEDQTLENANQTIHEAEDHHEEVEESDEEDPFKLDQSKMEE